MGDSRKAAQDLREFLAARFAEVSSELLQKKLIPKTLQAPSMEIILLSRAKTYLAKVEIEVSGDGKSVERTVIIMSCQYAIEIAKSNQKMFDRLLDILVAHLACNIYFPHDPSPGTFYWRAVMDVFGYFRAPRNIPHYPPIKCQRKQRRR